MEEEGAPAHVQNTVWKILKKVCCSMIVMWRKYDILLKTARGFGGVLIFIRGGWEKSSLPDRVVIDLN